MWTQDYYKYDHMHMHVWLHLSNQTRSSSINVAASVWQPLEFTNMLLHASVDQEYYHNFSTLNSSDTQSKVLLKYSGWF